MLDWKPLATIAAALLMLGSHAANAAVPEGKFVAYTYTGNALTAESRTHRGPTETYPVHKDGFVLEVLAPDFLPANQTITFSHRGTGWPYSTDKGYDLTLTLDAQGDIKTWDVMTEGLFSPETWWITRSSQSGQEYDSFNSYFNSVSITTYNVNQPGQWTKTVIDKQELFNRGERFLAPLPGVAPVPEADVAALAVAGLLTAAGLMRRNQRFTAP